MRKKSPLAKVAAERTQSLPPSFFAGAAPAADAPEAADDHASLHAKPLSSQRSLLAPVKIGASLSLGKPRLGSRLSTGSVPGIPSLGAAKFAAASASKVEYGKTRTDDAPFLVEVLKGIVGLGIKVKVNPEGHVEITEIQKNSPVDKNGNVK
jgi:hypothetical protein